MIKILLGYYSIGAVISAVKFGVFLSNRDKIPTGKLYEELHYYLIHNPLTRPKTVYEVIKNLESQK